MTFLGPTLSLKHRDPLSAPQLHNLGNYKKPPDLIVFRFNTTKTGGLIIKRRIFTAYYSFYSGMYIFSGFELVYTTKAPAIADWGVWIQIGNA